MAAEVASDQDAVAGRLHARWLQGLASQRLLGRWRRGRGRAGVVCDHLVCISLVRLDVSVAWCIPLSHACIRVSRARPSQVCVCVCVCVFVACASRVRHSRAYLRHFWTGTQRTAWVRAPWVMASTGSATRTTHRSTMNSACWRRARFTIVRCTCGQGLICEVRYVSIPANSISSSRDLNT